ncbi:glycosyltransferase [Pantoea sp.]|uniref:glycosyltransferase n=1 Tax=Pantoea sp. TaxID=69393 RepID=UPI0031E18A79
MGKLRVLHCYKTYYPVTFGGIEQVIFQLSEAMNTDEVESTVFCVNNSEDSGLEPFHNHYVFRTKKDFEIASTPFSFKAFKQFKELVKSFDIVHYHFPYPFMDMLHFASKVNKPSVVSYHSDIIKQKKLMGLYNPLMKRFLKSVDRIVTASPNYLNSSKVLQNYKDKVSIVPYGIPDITKSKSDADVNNEITKQFPNGYFLFVGSFRYYKGLHYLLEAMKDSNIPIVLLGANGEEDSLKKFVKEHNMTNINFVGAKDDSIKYSYLAKAVGFVFPSHLRSEAFGISLVEAACFGLPLISCEIGTGTTFINTNDQTGIVIDGANPEQLKRAVYNIWNDRSKSSEYGKRARERYEEIFTAKKMASEYLDIYEEVIFQHKNRQFYITR